VLRALASAPALATEARAEMQWEEQPDEALASLATKPIGGFFLFVTTSADLFGFLLLHGLATALLL
jgi:hypothetical protein